MPADLVLLHGFTQTGRSWQPVRQALGGRYRALAPDLPGHGAFAARPASFAACDAYLRAVCARDTTVCGYSMGGRIALHYALWPGARLGRLVLLGASTGLEDPAERAARREADARLAERIAAIGVAAFAAEWAAQPLFAGMPRGVAALADEDRRRNTASGLSAALRGLGTGAMPSLWDGLSACAVPVELIVGERDEKFRALAERMAGLLPAARLHVVPGAGHAVQLEAPDAVAEVLRAAVPTPGTPPPGSRGRVAGTRGRPGAGS